MKISEIFKSGQPTLSLEVFPPKTSEVYDSVEKATNEIAALKPDFMSVTYGAAGSTRTYTTAIASNIEKAGVTALAHLTCVNASKESIREQVEALKAAGIENILALRGDLPEGMESTDDWVYRHASELIPVIKEYGDFCIGGACYPEKHPEAVDLKTDIANMKKKVDAGCEFLTTQMFFDNNLLYNYLYRLREGGVPGFYSETICGIAGSLFGQSGSPEAGSDRLCDRSDHRSAGKWCGTYSCIYDEQTGCGSADPA